MSTPNVEDALRRREGPLRAAVVELQGVHDEVMPSLFDMLLANGIEPTGFLNSRLDVRGDVFRFTAHRDRVNYRPLTTAEEWQALVDEVSGFDLLVMNTYSYRGQAKFAQHTGLPTIGVVHNPKLVLNKRKCVNGIRSGRVTPVTLAPHVTSWMMAEAPELFSHAATLGTWMWEMPGIEASDPSQVRRIAVPGGVSFGKRDYPLVLDTIPGLIDRVGPERFEIAVVGGGADRARLEDLVAERGLTDVFDFAPLDPETGAVPSHEYYPRLAGATFLLPLLPERLHSYRVSKITAAVSSSVGFTVPAIIDRWTSTVYDLPGVTYSLGSLADGLVRAVEMSDDEVEAIRERLGRRRAAMIERANAEMGEALRVVGTAPPGAGRYPFGSQASEVATEPIEAEEPVASVGPGEVSSPVVVDRDDREAFLAFAQLVLPHSYSQRLQDLWALWESGFSTDGYFAEFGALNGRDFSNSYLAEQLGWTGVVAEPHPSYEEKIRSHRRCTISTKCVFDKTGETVEFHAVQGRPALSTMGGFGNDDSRSELRENFVTHQVETITLADLLAEARAPDVVDYLSIDTEGSEIVILRVYDFAVRPIRLITVEHNDAHRDELYDLLTAQGYRRKWPEISGHDDWYVHESAYPDWSAEGLPRLLEAAGRVAPFKNNYAVRQRLVGDLRASSTNPSQMLGIADVPLAAARANSRLSEVGEATLALAASYQFNRAFLPLLARRAGISESLLNHRVSTMFVNLCAKLKPTVTLEIGAFEASFSREMKRRLPDARVVAYEANPFVHQHFYDEVVGAGVVYEHKAAGTVSGTQTFNVPKDYRGAGRPLVNQMSSLKPNLSTVEHEQVSVPAVRIDDEFPGLGQERFVAWIDVEGAAEEVLQGAERVLSRTMAVYIEVESHPIWEGQWLDDDVAQFLLERGFVLIGRDQLNPRQFNLVFVHRSVAKRALVARHAARIYRAVRRAPAATKTPTGRVRRTARRLSRAVRRRTPRG